MHELPHAIKPLEQMRAHSPPLQNELAGHVIPHMPQLKGSVAVFTHDVPHSSRGRSQDSGVDPSLVVPPSVRGSTDGSPQPTTKSASPASARESARARPCSRVSRTSGR